MYNLWITNRTAEFEFELLSDPVSDNLFIFDYNLLCLIVIQLARINLLHLCKSKVIFVFKLKIIFQIRKRLEFPLTPTMKNNIFDVDSVIT